MGSMVAVGKAAGAEVAGGAVLGRWLAKLFTLRSSPTNNKNNDDDNKDSNSNNNKAMVGDTHRK